MPYNPIEVCLF